MRTISQGSEVRVLNAANSYTTNRFVEIGSLVEHGRDCLEQCLNGGGWFVSTQSRTSQDGSRTVALKTWTPRYLKNSSGQVVFAECGCPEFNTSYTPNVSVSVEGAVGQRYDIRAGRTFFDPRGGEIIDTSDTPGQRAGVIGDTGTYSTDFTFRLMHDETDGTMPPPTFWVYAVMGGVLPVVEAAIMPRQQIFSDCSADCSREIKLSGQINLWTPVLIGCQTDLRNDVVSSAAKLDSNFSVSAYPGEELGVVVRNIESPSIQDVVVVRLNVPNMTTRMSLSPFSVTSTSGFVHDENLSVYEVRNFDNSGSLLAEPSIEPIGPWSTVRTPNVPLADYFGNESRLIIMKNKTPGVCTDCGRDDFGGSCDLTGEWFLSKVGDKSYSDLRITSQLG